MSIKHLDTFDFSTDYDFSADYDYRSLLESALLHLLRNKLSEPTDPLECRLTDIIYDSYIRDSFAAEMERLGIMSRNASLQNILVVDKGFYEEFLRDAEVPKQIPKECMLPAPVEISSHPYWKEAFKYFGLGNNCCMIEEMNLESLVYFATNPKYYKEIEVSGRRAHSSMYIVAENEPLITYYDYIASAKLYLRNSYGFVAQELLGFKVSNMGKDFRVKEVKKLGVGDDLLVDLSLSRIQTGTANSNLIDPLLESIKVNTERMVFAKFMVELSKGRTENQVMDELLKMFTEWVATKGMLYLNTSDSLLKKLIQGFAKGYSIDPRR